MQTHGIIYSIGKTIQVSEKFSRREFVIETESGSQYPQYIQFELHKDRTDLIDPYKEGQDVSVDFNLKGRLWTNPQGETKCFTALIAWKIQPVNK